MLEVVMLGKILGALGGDLIGEIAGLFNQYQEGKLTRDQLKFELETFEERNNLTAALAQLDVNKTEAQHPSVFVSGWRPAVGWVCVSGFAMNFVISPIVTFIAATQGLDFVFPQADVDTMMPVLLGMLGLGGMRTYEKARGVARAN